MHGQQNIKKSTDFLDLLPFSIVQDLRSKIIAMKCV